MAGILNFTPNAYMSMAAGSTNNNLSLPTTSGQATVLVTNASALPAAVLLTTDAGAVASLSNGIVVMAGQSLALALGSNTRIAAIGLGFGNAQLNIAIGV